MNEDLQTEESPLQDVSALSSISGNGTVTLSPHYHSSGGGTTAGHLLRSDGWVPSSWESSVYHVPQEPKDVITQMEEVSIRERAIEKTVALFKDEEPDLEVFAVMLESMYNFLRYGTPIIIAKTNNQ
jgi:hypothetical protein